MAGRQAVAYLDGGDAAAFLLGDDASASCSDVSRNVATPEGTLNAILRIVFSGITPGPLGMADTRPTALAPYFIARRASLMVLMQQIFIRVSVSIIL